MDRILAILTPSPLCRHFYFLSVVVIWATLLPLICPRGLYTPPYSKRIDRKLVCIVLAIFEMILLHAYTCGKSGAHVLKTLKWHYSGGGKIYEIFPFGTSLNKLIHTLNVLDSGDDMDPKLKLTWAPNWCFWVLVCHLLWSFGFVFMWFMHEPC